MTHPRTYQYLTTALIVVCLLLSGCGQSSEAAAKTAETGTPSVAVAKVSRQHLAKDLELAAEFRPYQEIDLHAKVSGYLKAIHVDVGDRVTERGS